MKDNRKQRFLELEGLRGVAAVVVVLYHNLLAFYLVMFMGASTFGLARNRDIELFLHGNPIVGLLSGTFAVAIFFVLSGFVLSVGYYQTKNDTIIKKLAAKRYLRLMLPALASVLIAYILIKLNLSHTAEAASITNSSWLARNWNFDASFFGALNNATWGIFTQGSSPYNNVLWTMATEFAGSFLVFGSLLLFGKMTNRWVVYALLILVTINTWFFGFIAGMVMADLYVNRRNYNWQLSPYTACCVALVAITLGAYPAKGSDLTWYHYISPSFGNIHIDYKIIYLSIAAILLVGLVLYSPHLKKFFASKWLSGLGKYTFSLYLVHIPILSTFTTFVFIRALDHFGYNTAAWLSIIASVPLVVGAAYLFEKYVDNPSIRLASRFGNLLMMEESILNVVNRKLAYIRLRTRKLYRRSVGAFVGPRPESEPAE